MSCRPRLALYYYWRGICATIAVFAFDSLILSQHAKAKQATTQRAPKIPEPSFLWKKVAAFCSP